MSNDPSIEQGTTSGHTVPMPRAKDTAIIIPLLNEEPMIAQVVSQVKTIFPTVICVDDGSSDLSAEKALEAGAIVIPHPVNLGQGAALQTGFTYALTHTNAEYFVTFDADGQHSLDDAVAMVTTARASDLAIVYGSRFLGHDHSVRGLRRVILKLAVIMTRLRTGLHLTDAHNGLRVIRRDALCSLHLTRNRMAHASEIVDQLAKTGLPWKEHPVTIKYTDYSKAKGQSLLNSVNILVELIMR